MAKLSATVKEAVAVAEVEITLGAGYGSFRTTICNPGDIGKSLGV